MLSELSIRNFAIIENAHLHFKPGLNVLTGETGAGKSIVLGALDLVLGGRAAADLIRQGADSAKVEARFTLTEKTDEDWIAKQLTELGIEPDDDGDLLISRTISRPKDDSKAGKNQIFINGQMATRTALQTLASHLVDISGQREHQILLKIDNHRKILDHLVGKSELFAQMQTATQKLRDLNERFLALTQNQAENRQRRDYLTYQIQEIETIDPQAGEALRLQAELQRLAHTDDLAQTAITSIQTLQHEDEGVVTQLHRVLAALRKSESFDGRFQNPIKMLEEALINCQEAREELDQLSQSFEASPDRLREIEERLAHLHDLERKHGLHGDELLLHFEKMKAELQNLSFSEEDLSALPQEGEKALQACLGISADIHAQRQKTAASLRKLILRELGELAMAGADFKAELTGLPRQKNAFPTSLAEAGLNRFGSESIEFLLAPNKGEGLKPLAQIASGGELSRILLAMKCILSPAEATESYLFDEIDAGIGGVTGSVVGKKLKELSRKRQVICITHLPQIACFADHHLQVAKESAQGRTRTLLHELGQAEKIEELARMLGGDTQSNTSRAHAKALLDQCT